MGGALAIMRARNLLKCARAVAQDHGGQFPQTEAGLLGLRYRPLYRRRRGQQSPSLRPARCGGGRKCGAGCGQAFALEAPLPEVKPQMRALAARLTPQRRPGDHAQAMMDLGADLHAAQPGFAASPGDGHVSGPRAGHRRRPSSPRSKTAKPVRHGLL